MNGTNDTAGQGCTDDATRLAEYYHNAPADADPFQTVRNMLRLMRRQGQGGEADAMQAAYEAAGWTYNGKPGRFHDEPGDIWWHGKYAETEELAKLGPLDTIEADR